MDVVKRYDVDGIHFDDYFYPYSSYNDEIRTFLMMKPGRPIRSSGGSLSRGDWRRNAVNKFIEAALQGN